MTEFEAEHDSHPVAASTRAKSDPPLVLTPVTASSLEKAPAKSKDVQQKVVASPKPPPPTGDCSDLLVVLLQSGLKQTLASKTASLLHSQGMTREDMDEDFAEGYLNANEAGDWKGLSAPERSLVKIKLGRWIAGQSKG